MEPGSCRWDDEPDDDDVDFVPPSEKELEPEIEQIGLLRPGRKRVTPEEEVPVEMELIKEMEPMKPVRIDTKEASVHSKEGKGKIKYLKARNRDDPEDKYYSPVCTSWDYGWTYGEDTDLSTPTHGRVQMIKQSFFRQNDPQLKPRDPIN
ncbi:uncharacterized protein CEXT_781371 [Caerostris extrusa]|uniref:Sperm microtubule inner protein 1 C-terminal domain-containing protein n=1 Tax=Caerostris extrusa TaxID=172846 RepID=A0AAV4WTG4_CAEEX|nr:uncharacterized protein CEXT_781371 [Caerostris extrusa]